MYSLAAVFIVVLMVFKDVLDLENLSAPTKKLLLLLGGVLSKMDSSFTLPHAFPVL